MPRFRITVLKTDVSHQVIELDAANAAQAAVRADRFTDGQRRGVTVVQPYDDDPRASYTEMVVAVKAV